MYAPRVALWRGASVHSRCFEDRLIGRLGCLDERNAGAHDVRGHPVHLILELAVRARLEMVLDLVELNEAGGRRVGGYSLGMRQRLGLATALLAEPQILIADEPANGLDPEGIHWLRMFLRHLASQGKTVLVSSHLLSELDQTVDDVVIVARGKLVRQSSLAELVKSSQATMRVRTPEADRLVAILAAAGGRPRRVATDLVLVDGATPQWLGPILAHWQIVVYELTSEGGLEQVFLTLTAGTGYEGTIFEAPPPAPAVHAPQVQPPQAPTGLEAP